MSRAKKAVYPVLLAGGTGTRLWPVSREFTPKQLVNFIGRHTLIQATIKRVARLADTEKIRIVCRTAHFHEIARQMKDLGINPDRKIICEPYGRNTAPAILLAALNILRDETEAVLAIFPADHIVKNIDAFYRHVAAAIAIAGKGYIVTFGIKPVYPEIGYGYIEGDREICDGALSIKRFVEKPTPERANRYIQSGKFFWNSGMFAFKASVIIKEFKELQPRLYAEMAKIVGDNGISDKKAYERLPNISIDYAIMEKTKKGVVLPSDFKWSDIGSWKSLYDFLPKNKNQNVIIGDVIEKETKNSFIMAHERLIATNRIKNMAIIDTPDSVFISDLDTSRDVKSIVETLQKMGRRECRRHRTALHSWGRENLLEQSADANISRLIIYSRSVCPDRVDAQTVKHFLVIKGRAKIKNKRYGQVLEKGDSTLISGETDIRIENLGDDPLHMIRVKMDLPVQPI